MSDNAPTRWSAETLQILHESQAILADDHFVYISGDHGSGWIAKDMIFVDMQRAHRLGQLLSEAIRHCDAEIVCGPATGGLIVAQWTAYALGLPMVFAEHDPSHKKSELRGRFGLHRGFDRLVADRRVLVVDDVVNTGHSVRQTVEAVRACGGTVGSVATLVDRGNVGAADIGVDEYAYLLRYDIPSWPAAQCPLCKQQVPVNVLYAHGQDFLDARQEQDA